MIAYDHLAREDEAVDRVLCEHTSDLCVVACRPKPGNVRAISSNARESPHRIVTVTAASRDDLSWSIDETLLYKYVYNMYADSKVLP